MKQKDLEQDVVIGRPSPLMSLHDPDAFEARTCG